MYQINEIAILLTTYCSDSERIEIYEKRVMRWLTDSPFDVYLVDSANTGMKNPEILNHPRYQQLLFNQKAPEHYNKIKCLVSDEKLLNNPDYAHTTYERYSVVLAIRKFHFIGKYKLLYKITGKYFIPDWNHLLNVRGNCIFQSKHRYAYQNSELFGCGPLGMLHIFMKMKNEKILEEVLGCLNPTYRLPPLKLDMFVGQGDINSIAHTEL